jgi:hypothetical protein
MLIVTLFLMASCSMTAKDNRLAWYTPKLWRFSKNIPQDDSSYSSGFRAGCNDGMGVSGFGGLGLHEIRHYGFGQAYDFDRAKKDTDYTKGYGEAFYYCSSSANSVIGF